MAPVVLKACTFLYFLKKFGEHEDQAKQSHGAMCVCVCEREREREREREPGGILFVKAVAIVDA